MDKESFKIIKEINSLCLQQDKILQEIGKEESRIDKLKLKKIHKQEEHSALGQKLEHIKALLQATENEIAKYQKSYELTKTHMQNAITEQEISALSQQHKHAQENLDQLETEGLSQMEQAEIYEDELKLAREFLKNIDGTIQEIENEIKLITQPLKEKNETLLSRISLLLAELPKPAQDKLNSLILKKLPYGPIAFVESQKCSICRYHLDRALIDDIEKNQKFKTCHGCQRILIPQNASTY